jgi:hypothetical protein
VRHAVFTRVWNTLLSNLSRPVSQEGERTDSRLIPTGESYLVLEQPNNAEIAKGKRYRFWGAMGISLVALSSLIQIGATWL